MKKSLRELAYKYVNENIGEFHRKRIEALNKLKLNTVLKKKNPYLFKAKYLLTAETIVKSITDAFISSHEETIFGDWLEGLAIYINQKVYGGRKSGIPGIDLEFDLKGVMINRFTKDFSDNFCTSDGAIDWNKLVIFNSRK